MSQRLRIFISASSGDSGFVERLDVHLKAQDFDVKLNRGFSPPTTEATTEDYWHEVDQCGVMLAILSPAGLADADVKEEWQFGINKGKPIISLEIRVVDNSKVPPELAPFQRIDFMNADYMTALNNLLFSLAFKQFDTATWQNNSLDERRADDIDQLFDLGLHAERSGDLERAAVLFQFIVEHEPNHPSKESLLKIQPTVRYRQIQRLYNAAEDARTSGRWSYEITALGVIQGLDPSKKPELARRLEIAQHNQKHVPSYERVKRALERDQVEVAKEYLRKFWSEEAPNYGDPSNLGARVGLTAPKSSISDGPPPISAPPRSAERNATPPPSTSSTNRTPTYSQSEPKRDNVLLDMGRFVVYAVCLFIGGIAGLIVELLAFPNFHPTYFGQSRGVSAIGAIVGLIIAWLVARYVIKRLGLAAKNNF